MARAETLAGVVGTVRDHGFHALRVARVVQETADSCSLVFEVPEELRETFAYDAGQFCNLRVDAAGASYVRCYSMSSAPALGEDLQVTVKRVPGGVVSNWLNDHAAPGLVLELSPPSGFFRLTGCTDELVAFAAGSGITPVFSLVKTALATTGRRVRLLYANRGPDSVIFGRELAELARSSQGRLRVTHHLDSERGMVDREAVEAFLAKPPAARTAEHYLCGPAPFMEVVEQSLLATGVEPGRIHIERFTPAELPPLGVDLTPAGVAPHVTIQLDGRRESTEHRPGTTILQTARQLGMSPPFSCESGSCATCMARVVTGEVSMLVNNALTPEEVDDGWILTCQAVPVSPEVHVVYEGN